MHANRKNKLIRTLKDRSSKSSDRCLTNDWFCKTELLSVRFQVLTTASMKFRVFWDVAPCSLFRTDVSEVRTASIISAMVEAVIALMMEAVRTCETSVHTAETTRHYIPADSKLQNCWLICEPVSLLMSCYEVSVHFHLWTYDLRVGKQVWIWPSIWKILRTYDLRLCPSNSGLHTTGGPWRSASGFGKKASHKLYQTLNE
jgi:hypothetical protein